jgi:hypothetical protein
MFSEPTNKKYMRILPPSAGEYIRPDQLETRIEYTGKK